MVGELPRQRLVEVMRGAGVVVDEGAAMTVVMTDDYLRPELRELVAQGGPVLLVRPTGMKVWMGPVVRDAAAYDELAYWLRARRAERALVAGWEYPPAIAVAATEWSLALVAGWVGTMLASREELRVLRTFDLRRGVIQEHPVWRRGKFVPEQWLSAKTGIATRVVGEYEAYGLHHAGVEHCLAPLGGRRHRRRNAGFAYGSGVNREQARARAVFEAVERFAAHADGEEELVVQCYEPGRCVHPREILQYSEAQYEEDASAPARFREDVPVAWMWARALGDYPDQLVPAALVLLDYADEAQPRFAVTESTGCAAGATREEAIAAGWREVVERDAVARWWYGRLEAPAVEWGEVAECAETGWMLEREWGRLEVLDVGAGMGPVCVAVSSREDGREVVFGAGAGGTWQEACARAVREVAQVRVWRKHWGDRAVMGYEELQPFQRAGRGNAVETREVKRYWVDLTRRRVGLPVVRVIAPGMWPNGLRWRDPSGRRPRVECPL
jgi:ribosomal protein S12 methylthiotransferase accessory factor YcaO